MSKKDKAQEQTQATAAVSAVSPAVPSLADVLKDAEGVTISDDKRMRVTAADKETLAERVTTVKSALADYNITVSPVYGNAEALGCVWNDIIATPKK